MAKMAEMLKAKGAKPLLVIEHAYEEATTMTLNPVAAHAASTDYVKRVFGAIAA